MKSVLWVLPVILSAFISPQSNASNGKSQNPCASVPNSKATFDPITKEFVGCVINKVDPKSGANPNGLKPGDVVKVYESEIKSGKSKR